MHLRPNELTKPGLIISHMVEKGVDISFKFLECLPASYANNVLLEEMPQALNEV